MNASSQTAEAKLFSVIILTRNEERHIERSVRSALRLTPHVFVVDSHSADRTAEIARRFTPNIVFGNFPTFSEKLNWAIDQLPICTPWTIRLDADEIFAEDFLVAIGGLVANQPLSVGGVWVRRQVWFMNRWMRHGAIYPVFALRVWRTGCARCKLQVIDEYMELTQGAAVTAHLDLIDNPVVSIAQWIEKHNRYSETEADYRYVQATADGPGQRGSLFGRTQEARTAFLKNRVYYRVPLFVRPFLLFVYKYIFRAGFLDGTEGLVWHILHTFWYRILIDIKIFEKRLAAKKHGGG